MEHPTNQRGFLLSGILPLCAFPSLCVCFWGGGGGGSGGPRRNPASLGPRRPCADGSELGAGAGSVLEAGAVNRRPSEPRFPALIVELGLAAMGGGGGGNRSLQRSAAGLLAAAMPGA